MKKTTIARAIVAAVAMTSAAHAVGRDYISVVGSSTVYPFSTVVAETYGKTSGFKTPKVESTGTGGGLKLFCGGIGTEYPDIANASRRIKQTEVDLCSAGGVTDIVEVKIGFDGIVMASDKSAAPMNLSLKDVHLALAKDVPDPNGGDKLVANPYKTWKDVNAELPANAIEVLGPPPTSGTRDAFVELAMDGGCQNYPFLAAMKKSNEAQFKAVCYTLRTDGAYIEAGENDNLIVQKLQTNPKALGIFGYSFLDQNIDVVQGNPVNGVAPTFEAIQDGSYPISRPLFFYAKKGHIGPIPGIEEFLAEFTSDAAFGDGGYLSDKGLIPLPEAQKDEVVSIVKNLTSLDLSASAK